MTTSNQLRAARSLLGWTQHDLAVVAKVSVSVVKRVEGAHDMLAPVRSAAVILAVLEQAGIEFISEDDGTVGVRLKGKKLGTGY